jgi:hypothetical protein
MSSVFALSIEDDGVTNRNIPWCPDVIIHLSLSLDSSMLLLHDTTVEAYQRGTAIGTTKHEMMVNE